MSLKEAALEAAKESQDEYRLRALQDRETKLTALIEKWDEKWEWKYNLGTPPVPDRSEFTFGKVRGDSYRAETLHGFRFEIEEIPFIYSTTYGDEGLHLILTCPECQQEHATHFHSLSALGELLKKNRSISHRCLENEIKDVAYAIRSTARALKLPDAHVAELALQKAYELS